MLPRFLPILLVVGVQVVFVVSQDFAPPEMLAANSPDSIFQPLAGKFTDQDVDDAVDNSKVIRGLLVVRQDSCPVNYAVCNDGGCCPVGGACCGSRKCCSTGRWCYGNGCCRTSESGCEGNSCCTPSQTCCQGGGCCNPGWHCDVVNGVKGCCRNGRDCGTDDGVCTTSGYVHCEGENFCCPAGYDCYRDAAGAAKCRRGSGSSTSTRTPTASGFSSTPRPTNTSVGSVSSAVILKNSFNLFSIAQLLGWIAYVL